MINKGANCLNNPLGSISSCYCYWYWRCLYLGC